MFKDPVGPLTAADTLLTGIDWVQPLNTPSELTSAGFTLQSLPTSRCIAKPAGQLRFVLNSVLDLGFPAAFDFDVTFVGTVVQAITTTNPAYIRFDVNQVVQKTFTLPSGLAVLVDTVTGGIQPGAVPLQQPFAGVSCSG